ncbi:NUDIX hydrolase [Ramlibacter sp.]|uniref:NUDIX hydrolase n=1 Tax=Ramlibacter sp. TaxID=1917967 RepID=UPI0017B46E03|nr:NUDIX hydrolase [Ramlibacter sp.]MBA2672084.1 NUDIX hydrolase [Ramlibacter sp.]
MTDTAFTYCPACATALRRIAQVEDGGPKERLRCPACGWTHWNNPTPVLAAVIQYRDRILLARNAAWKHKMYALVTGFMEAGETPEDGIRREIKEETNLDTVELNLIGVWDFQRMNQVIIAYHALARGEVMLSPELVDYKLLPYDEVKCWSAGTGQALAKWLRGRGYEPEMLDAPRPDADRTP